MSSTSMAREGKGQRSAVGRSRTERLAFVVVPLALLVASYALFFSASGPSRENLQLVAEDVAAPGETMGLRALFYTHLGEPGDVITEKVKVAVALMDGAKAIAQTELGPSRVDGAEGAITVPASAHGELMLVATVLYEGEPIAVQRPLRIAPRAPAHGPRRRVVSPLMAYELLEAKWEGGHAGEAVPPVSLDVALGGCVPEAPCVLEPRDAPPGARWSIPESAGFGVQSVADDGVTLGVVHGPEAAVQYRAVWGDGRALTFRVRLPVVLGGLSFVRPTAVAKGEPIRFNFGKRLAGRGFVYDAFVDGRYVRAGSFAVDGSGYGTVGEGWPEGRWRLQVRSSPYGMESALTAVVDVGTAAPRPPGLEDDLMDLPEAVGSRAQASAVTDRRVTVMRWLVFIVFTVSAFFVSFLVLYGGLRARRQAAELMAAAKAEAESDSSAPAEQNPELSKLMKLRSLFDVVGLALLVFLAMVCAAILMVIRGLF